MRAETDPPPPPASAPPTLPSEARPSRDLPRLLGLMLFGLLAAGALGLPVLALVWWLFSLPWMAAMFAVLSVTALGGLAVLEYIRLRGWRYSLRQMVAAALILFLIGNFCVGLGYKQYEESWAQKKPLRLDRWAELSLDQKRELAERLVSGAVQASPAELLDLRAQADFKERAAVRQGRTVREFACAIGPWKLLGQECLIVRIDYDNEIPYYYIERVQSSEWWPENETGVE